MLSRYWVRQEPLPLPTAATHSLWKLHLLACGPCGARWMAPAMTGPRNVCHDWQVSWLDLSLPLQRHSGIGCSAGFANLLRALLPEQVVNPGEIPGLSFLARIVGWIVAILGMVLLAVLLSYWLQGLLRSFVGDATIHKRSAGAGGVLTSAAVRQQAQEAANAGRYRNAVRRLYLSALLLLEEQGIVAHDRSLTNHEMLSSIDQDHPMRTYLQPVVEAFDEVWYGIHEPDLGTYVAYEQDVHNLVETATGNAPAGGRDGREAHG